MHGKWVVISVMVGSCYGMLGSISKLIFRRKKKPVNSADLVPGLDPEFADIEEKYTTCTSFESMGTNPDINDFEKFIIGDPPSNLSEAWKATRSELNRLIAKTESDRKQPNAWKLSYSRYGWRTCEIVESDNTAGLKYTLKTPYDREGATVIFRAHADKMNSDDPPMSVMIKYTNNCGEDPRDMDNALWDYLVVKTLENLGIDIAPKLLAISAPGVVDLWSSDPRMSVPHGRCGYDDDHLDAIVVEDYSTEPTLIEYVKRASADPSLVWSIVDLTRLVIVRLRELHNAGIVHGDIAADGIIVEFTEDSPIIRFTDFRHSKFFPSERPLAAADMPNRSASVRSHWELKGFRVGRRDDLFRALETAIDLLSGTNTYFEGMDQNDLYTWKATRPLFSELSLCQITARYVDNPRYHETACNPAMRILDEALDTVRSIPDPDAEPEYDKIIASIERALVLLD
jgi:hypothetical protein